MSYYSLSVIIPVYNSEGTIKKALNSVINQPYSKYIEVIAVNDGSTDNSFKICSQIATHHTNVKIINKSNGGVSSARNLGIETATGKYLAFLDSDDWWENNFFDKEMYEQLCSNDLDIYGFSYNIVSTNLKYMKTLHVDNAIYHFDNHSLNRYNWYSFCSFIINRDFLLTNNLRFLNTKVNEDQPLIEMSLYLAKSFQTIDKPIFSYHSNTNSCLHTTNYIEYIDEKYKSFEISSRWFQDHGEEYGTDYSTCMLARELLPHLCAYNTYKFAKTYMDNDKKFAVLKSYKSIGLLPSLYKFISEWMEHPFRFWIKQKIFFKPINDMRNYLYRHPLLRALPDYLFYKRRKYTKYNEQENSTNT